MGEAVTTRTTNLIRESRLPISLWGEAAKATVYTLNRVLSKTSPVTHIKGGTTAYQMCQT